MKPRIPSQPERIRSTTMDQQQFWECKSHLQEGCKLEAADNTWSGWKVIRLCTDSVSALTRMFTWPWWLCPIQCKQTLLCTWSSLEM
jgi:hypothetical protein